MTLISYAVTVCDEEIEFSKLMNFFKENKRKDEEVVVLVDLKKVTRSLLDQLNEFLASNTIDISFRRYFDGNFAAHKNALNSRCTGKWIFQIDVDEEFHPNLYENLPAIVELNADVDLVWIPRVNTVAGLTDEHIRRWGWKVNDKGYINMPDYQGRLYKNRSEIQWKNTVHEVIHGYRSFAHLPPEEEWSLYHRKDIKKQEKQNSFYIQLTTR